MTAETFTALRALPEVETGQPGPDAAREPESPAAGIALREQPFDNTRDTRYFFASEGHAEALSRLRFLAADRNMGMGLLTGEIGSGKTLVRTLLNRELARPDYMVVSLENCLLDFDGLLLEIISQMRGERVGVNEMPDRYTRLSSFKQLLMRRVAEPSRHLLVLLDEAQQLSPANLEALRALTNIASERQNFLTLVLIGQPDLRNTVRGLPQIDQRIGLRYHLGALSYDDTRQYLEHRLEVAGFQGRGLFDEAALGLLFETSGGIPREINRVCKLALDHARANALPSVTARVVESVTDDRQVHGGLFDPCALVQ